MKIVHVVPYLRVESAGPSYSVPALCRGLVNSRCDVTLCTTGGMPSKCFPFEVRNFDESVFPHPKFARSPNLMKYLRSECKVADIICSNSLWTFPNVYPARAKSKTRCKLVTAPRGTMSRWAWNYHWPQKKIFGWYAQYKALRSTDMWHATCEKEYNEIRDLGYKQPIAIVPIGIDLPSVTPKEDVGEHKKVVFFGRLHRIKGIDNLIMAWADIVHDFPDWDLEIAGPDGGVRSQLESLIHDKMIPRVKFVGEINGPDKYKFLSSADLYVLPSHTENFAVTVAEALACETPVIASRGTPWEGLGKNNAGWWISNKVEDIARTLKIALSMSQEELKSMGRRGREWMKRDFEWDAIGAKMKMAYEWLIGCADKPDWVIVE